MKLNEKIAELPPKRIFAKKIVSSLRIKHISRIKYLSPDFSQPLPKIINTIIDSIMIRNNK